MTTFNTQIPILIVIVPLFTAFILPIIGWYKKQMCHFIAVAALIITTAISLRGIFLVIEKGVIYYNLGGWVPPWGIEFKMDHLSAMMSVLLLSIASLVGIYSQKSIQKECPEKETHFYALYLLLISGLLGMVNTGDMFNLYVFLEISSISGYALISIGDRFAPVMTFKYLMMGTVGACFYLLGVSYLYSVTGSLNMADLGLLLPGLLKSKVVLVAFIFIIIGCCVKVALFPLHSWLPGAYASAPSAVSALIAPTMTKVSAYVIIRVMFSVFQPEFSLQTLPIGNILSWLAAIAIIYGSVKAISQSDIKLMLAYSSVAQVGYIILGITLGNESGYKAGVLHIINHAVMKGCLFAAVGMMIYRLDIRRIEDLSFLHRKMPFTAFAFAVAALSMIGLPPTAGFFSKWYLLMGTVEAKQWIFTFVVLTSTLLNAAYFFRVMEYIYIKPKRAMAADMGHHSDVIMNEAPLSMLIPVLIMGGSVIALFFWCNLIVENIINPIMPLGFQ